MAIDLWEGGREGGNEGGNEGATYTCTVQAQRKPKETLQAKNRCGSYV